MYMSYFGKSFLLKDYEDIPETDNTVTDSTSSVDESRGKIPDTSKESDNNGKSPNKILIYTFLVH